MMSSSQSWTPSVERTSPELLTYHEHNTALQWLAGYLSSPCATKRSLQISSDPGIASVALIKQRQQPPIISVRSDWGYSIQIRELYQTIRRSVSAWCGL